jgi:WD40 repeat protein
VSTGKPLHRLGHYWGDSVAYAPDGKTLASTGAPSAVRLWDPASGKEVGLDLDGHQSAVLHVVVSTDGKLVATGGDHLRLWEARTGKHLRRIGVPGNYVEALAISPDGKTVVTGGRDKVVRFWDVETGKEIDQIKGHRGTLRALAFSPDGKLLASGDVMLDIRIWDAPTRKELHKVKIQGTVTDRLTLAFSPDSKALACGGAVNADFPKGVPSTDLMSFSLPGKGYPVLLLDAATGQETGRLEGAYNRIRSLAFSPDGKVLAATTSDGRISLWDVTTRKEQLCIAAHPENIDSSFRSSPSIGFAPDGHTLVSVSTDGTIRLWCARTGKERGRLQGPGALNAVAFVPDGKTLFTGGGDASVLAWDAAYLQAVRPTGKRNFSMGHIDLR